MDRRGFLLTSLAGALAAPLAAGGQQASKIARIGMLRSEYRRPDDPPLLRNMDAFHAGLRDEGYVEAQHYRIDYRSPKTETERSEARTGDDR